MPSYYTLNSRDIVMSYIPDTNSRVDFSSATPATIPPGTINGFLLEVIAPDTLSVDVRLYLDGLPTSLVCTVLAGQLSCSATGSVAVAEIGEIAMKNEGPIGILGNTGVLRDPTAIVIMQIEI